MPPTRTPNHASLTKVSHRGRPALSTAEAGNTAHPDFESLARFLSPAVRERVPPPLAGTKGGGAVDPVWGFHNYLPMTDGLGRDHLYALAPAATGAFADSLEYSRAAGLVQHAQYQALFEAYLEHIFDYTSAIIMWKSAGVSKPETIPGHPSHPPLTKQQTSCPLLHSRGPPSAARCTTTISLPQAAFSARSPRSAASCTPSCRATHSSRAAAWSL